MYNGIASQSQAGARVWFAAIVLTSLSAAPAWAQARKAAAENQAPVGFSLAGAKALFKRVDKDADGALSPSESPASGLGPRDVTAADADKNGRLSESEFLVGFHSWLSASGRTIEADLEAEVAMLRAAAKPAAPASPAQPAGGTAAAKPAPPRAAAPPPNPADEINRKIDEALRKAQEQDAAAPGGAARPRGADSEPAAPADLAGLSKEAQDALNRRLRTSGVTPETAAAERQALQQRIDNAGAAGAAASPAQPAAPAAPGAVGAPAKPAPAAPGGPATGSAGNAPAGRAAAPAPDANAGSTAARAAGSATPNAPTSAPLDPDAAAKLQRALDATERRMKKDGASAEEIEAAKEQLRQRAQAVNNAATPAATPAAAPATPAATPASEPKPSAAPTDPEMAAKLQRALEMTERRMKKEGASAEEIEAAKEQLRQRAQQGTPAATPAVAPATPPTASPASAPKPAATPTDPEMAAKLQRALDMTERRMKKEGASAEEIEAAKEQLRQRAQQGSPAATPAATPATPPNAAPAATPKPTAAPAEPAPAADEDEGPEQDPAVLRNRLEVLLKARNASPAEAEAERAKLEKRIARQASGVKGPKAKARAEAEAAGASGGAPSGAGEQPKPAESGATPPQRPAANPARGGAGNGRAAQPAPAAPGARPASAPAAPASGRGADGAKPQRP